MRGLALAVAVWTGLLPCAAARDAAAGPGKGEVLAWLNAERSRRSSPALSPDAALDRVAQARAEEVAAVDNPEDAETPAEDIAQRTRRAGYDHNLVAEIVLAGQGPLAERLEHWSESGDETFADSVRPEYRDLGVGVSRRGERLIVAVVLGLSAGEAFTTRTGKLSDRKSVREDLLSRVNAERRRRGIPPLRENAMLDKAAQAHAEDMLRRSYYGHESPERATAMDRAERASYSAAVIGENIAQGQASVAEVMDSWMASAEHRDHILGRAFSEIGLGLALGRNALGYQVLWVQVFGVPGRRENVPPSRRPPGSGR